MQNLIPNSIVRFRDSLWRYTPKCLYSLEGQGRVMRDQCRSYDLQLVSAAVFSKPLKVDDMVVTRLGTVFRVLKQFGSAVYAGGAWADKFTGTSIKNPGTESYLDIIGFFAKPEEKEEYPVDSIVVLTDGRVGKVVLQAGYRRVVDLGGSLISYLSYEQPQIRELFKLKPGMFLEMSRMPECFDSLTDGKVTVKVDADCSTALTPSGWPQCSLRPDGTTPYRYVLRVLDETPPEFLPKVKEPLKADVGDCLEISDGSFEKVMQVDYHPRGFRTNAKLYDQFGQSVIPGHCVVKNLGPSLNLVPGMIVTTEKGREGRVLSRKSRHLDGVIVRYSSFECSIHAWSGQCLSSRFTDLDGLRVVKAVVPEPEVKEDDWIETWSGTYRQVFHTIGTGQDLMIASDAYSRYLPAVDNVKRILPPVNLPAKVDTKVRLSTGVEAHVGMVNALTPAQLFIFTADGKTCLTIVDQHGKPHPTFPTMHKEVIEVLP